MELSCRATQARKLINLTVMDCGVPNSTGVSGLPQPESLENKGVGNPALWLLVPDRG